MNEEEKLVEVLVQASYIPEMNTYLFYDELMIGISNGYPPLDMPPADFITKLTTMSGIEALGLITGADILDILEESVEVALANDETEDEEEYSEVSEEEYLED